MNHNILIVESNRGAAEELAKLVRDAANRANIDVNPPIVAHTIDEANQYLNSNQRIDLTMVAGASGADSVPELRHWFPDVPIAMIARSDNCVALGLVRGASFGCTLEDIVVLFPIFLKDAQEKPLGITIKFHGRDHTMIVERSRWWEFRGHCQLHGYVWRKIVEEAWDTFGISEGAVYAYAKQLGLYEETVETATIH